MYFRTNCERDGWRLIERRAVTIAVFLLTTIAAMAIDVIGTYAQSPITILDSDSTATAQGKIDDASCGDIIEFEESGTWDGPFLLPDQGCAGPTYTIVRRANESLIPADDTRIEQGVTDVGMPLLQTPTSGSNQAVLTVLGNGDYYDISGLAITTNQDETESPIGAYVYIGKADASGTRIDSAFADLPHHIKFHHNKVYGGSRGNARNAMVIEGDTLSIRDNLFLDIHCSRSQSSECHGIASIVASNVLIKNNEINAAMAIFTGGSDPPAAFGSINPIHWEIAYNWMHSDPEWDYYASRHGHTFTAPDCGGIGCWINKNAYELKTGVDVNTHHNIIENSWSGDQPTGLQVLFTNLNQDGKCTFCTIAGAVFEYNVVRHMPGAFSIAGNNGYNRYDGSVCALAGPRNSVSDAVVTGGVNVSSATANLESDGSAVGATVVVGGASRTIASVQQGGNYSPGTPSQFTLNSAVSNGTGISLVFDPNPPTYAANAGCSLGTQADGLTIANNLIYDVGHNWRGAADPNTGKMWLIGSFDNVTVKHNTLVGHNTSSATMLYGAEIGPYDGPPTASPSAAFNFSDNILEVGVYGIFSSYGFGKDALNYNSGGGGDYTMAKNWMKAVFDDVTLAGTVSGSNYTNNTIVDPDTWAANFEGYVFNDFSDPVNDFKVAASSGMYHTASDGENVGITDAGWIEIAETMQVDQPGYTVGGGEGPPPETPVRVPLPIRIAWLVCPFPFIPYRRENPLG